MKNKHLLTLLLFTPLLLGNAIAKPYTNYEIGDITYESTHYSDSYIFSAPIKNTGKGYIDIASSFRDGEDFTYNTYLSVYDSRLLVKPGQQTIVKGFSSVQNINKDKIKVYAYEETICVPIDSQSVKYSFDMELDEYKADEGIIFYYYQYNIDFKLPDSKYNYSTIIEYTANGEEYAIFHQGYGNVFTLTTYEKVNNPKSEIKDIKIIAVRGSDKTSLFGELLSVGSIILLGVGFLLLAGAITAAIVVPLTIASRKKKKSI